ncbi:MAG: dihydroorotase [Proteobacteria bacterium]|nr:dihydroorotase [Pseudomonadota bacterium]
MATTIKNGRLFDPANKLDTVADIHINHGRIIAVGDAPSDFIAAKTIDATNLLVIPGLIDLSTRLGEPGLEHFTTIAQEGRAAAAGGITSLCVMPDTDPVNDSFAVTELIQRRARQAGTAFVLPVGALTKGLKGEALSEMVAMQREGCIAFSQANTQIVNTQTLFNAFDYAATHNFLMMMRPIDAYLGKDGVAHRGAISSALGLPDIPAATETLAVARLLLLAEETGVRLHLSQLSTARAVDMLADAQARGLPVTGDVAIHNLHLTEFDTADFASFMHVQPPLRSQRDRDALRAGVKAGIINAVCSDHTPLMHDDKLLPFPESVAGISGLESLLPLLLALVREHVLTLEQAITAVTHNPAKLLGINRGNLTVGTPADITIVDLSEEWLFNRHQLFSSGDNTPFHKWPFTGRVKTTLFQGQVTFQS